MRPELEAPGRPKRLQTRAGPVLLRRPVASYAGRRRRVHTSDDGAQSGRRTYHNRQMVVLQRSDWRSWLERSRPEAELLRPLSPDSLRLEQVR